MKAAANNWRRIYREFHGHISAVPARLIDSHEFDLSALIAIISIYEGKGKGSSINSMQKPQARISISVQKSVPSQPPQPSRAVS